MDSYIYFLNQNYSNESVMETHLSFNFSTEAEEAMILWNGQVIYNMTHSIAKWFSVISPQILKAMLSLNKQSSICEDLATAVKIFKVIHIFSL